MILGSISGRLDTFALGEHPATRFFKPKEALLLSPARDTGKTRVPEQ